MADVSGFVRIDRSVFDDNFPARLPAQQGFKSLRLAKRLKHERGSVEIQIKIARACHIGASDSFDGAHFFGKPRGYLSRILFLPGRRLPSLGKFERDRKREISEFSPRGHLYGNLRQIDVE